MLSGVGHGRARKTTLADRDRGNQTRQSERGHGESEKCHSNGRGERLIVPKLSVLVLRSREYKEKEEISECFFLFYRFFTKFGFYII